MEVLERQPVVRPPSPEPLPDMKPVDQSKQSDSFEASKAVSPCSSGPGTPTRDEFGQYDGSSVMLLNPTAQLVPPHSIQPTPPSSSSVTFNPMLSNTNFLSPVKAMPIGSCPQIIMDQNVPTHPITFVGENGSEPIIGETQESRPMVVSCETNSKESVIVQELDSEALDFEEYCGMILI